MRSGAERTWNDLCQIIRHVRETTIGGTLPRLPSPLPAQGAFQPVALGAEHEPFAFVERIEDAERAPALQQAPGAVQQVALQLQAVPLHRRERLARRVEIGARDPFPCGQGEEEKGGGEMSHAFQMGAGGGLPTFQEFNVRVRAA